VGEKMDIGNFYFLKNDYFVDFPDEKLMKNKEVINGQVHDRPCFYAFLDNKTNIYWMIPFSSQVKKFKEEYNKKIAKSKDGKCDTIVFGEVLGHEKAFLIQNMCPVLPRYIHNEYIDKVANLPVKVNGALEKDLLEKARKILNLQRKGFNLIFPNVLQIEQALINELKAQAKEVLK
jgi:hypothetical protein